MDLEAQSPIVSSDPTLQQLVEPLRLVVDLLDEYGDGQNFVTILCLLGDETLVCDRILHYLGHTKQLTVHFCRYRALELLDPPGCKHQVNAQEWLSALLPEAWRIHGDRKRVDDAQLVVGGQLTGKGV